MEVKGSQFAVELVPRGPKDNHICLQLKGEDDENWFNIGNSFSSFWLNDLIRVLQNAQTMLDDQCVKDPKGWGYDFKEKVR